MWSHTYNENEIPGPNPSGTITEHSPGKKIAKAITELEEKVIAGIGQVTLTDIDGTIEIVNNKLVITLSTIPQPREIPVLGNQGDVLVYWANGEYAWEPKYPEDRNIGDVLTVGPTNDPVWSAPDAGLPTPGNEGDILKLSSSLEPQWGRTDGLTKIVKQVVDMKFEDNKLKVVKRDFDYLNGLLQSISLEAEETVIEFQPFECG
jgi:hypothetical protein